MSVKQCAYITAAVATAATIGFTALAPHDDKTPSEVQQQRQEQRVHDLSENEKNVHQQWRQDGNDLLDAVNEDELRPGEVRPPEPGLKPKFKIPLP